jgi:hypothetical protein
MTEVETLGLSIVNLFNLPKLRGKSNTYGKAYYYTAWGDKTLEGIGNCVLRLVDERNT